MSRVSRKDAGNSHRSKGSPGKNQIAMAVEQFSKDLPLFMQFIALYPRDSTLSGSFFNVLLWRFGCTNQRAEFAHRFEHSSYYDSRTGKCLNFPRMHSSKF